MILAFYRGKIIFIYQIRKFITTQLVKKDSCDKYGYSNIKIQTRYIKIR